MGGCTHEKLSRILLDRLSDTCELGSQCSRSFGRRGSWKQIDRFTIGHSDPLPLHAERGEATDRAVEGPLQHGEATFIAGVQAACAGGCRTRGLLYCAPQPSGGTANARWSTNQLASTKRGKVSSKRCSGEHSEAMPPGMHAVDVEPGSSVPRSSDSTSTMIRVCSTH